jgi:hypothetical protein
MASNLIRPLIGAIVFPLQTNTQPAEVATLTPELPRRFVLSITLRASALAQRQARVSSQAWRRGQMQKGLL